VIKDNYHHNSPNVEVETYNCSVSRNCTAIFWLDRQYRWKNVNSKHL